VARLATTNVIGEERNGYELTIKSAKGLPTVGEYLKHLGLVKIGGVRDGEIDAGEEVGRDGQGLVYRERNPYRVN